MATSGNGGSKKKRNGARRSNNSRLEVPKIRRDRKMDFEFHEDNLEVCNGGLKDKAPNLKSMDTFRECGMDEGEAVDLTRKNITEPVGMPCTKVKIITNSCKRSKIVNRVDDVEKVTVQKSSQDDNGGMQTRERQRKLILSKINSKEDSFTKSNEQRVRKRTLISVNATMDGLEEFEDEETSTDYLSEESEEWTEENKAKNVKFKSSYVDRTSKTKSNFAKEEVNGGKRSDNKYYSRIEIGKQEKMNETGSKAAFTDNQSLKKKLPVQQLLQEKKMKEGIKFQNLRKSESLLLDSLKSMESMLDSLTDTKDSIRKTSQHALECARLKAGIQVVFSIVNRLESESNQGKRITLFLLLFDIIQISFQEGDNAFQVYPKLVKANLPRILSAAAPPGKAFKENRKQCLQVLKIWLSLRIFPDMFLNHFINEMEMQSKDDGNMYENMYRIPKTERALEDPMLNCEIDIDEYGSNTRFEIPGHVFSFKSLPSFSNDSEDLNEKLATLAQKGEEKEKTEAGKPSFSSHLPFFAPPNERQRVYEEKTHQSFMAERAAAAAVGYPYPGSFLERSDVSSDSPSLQKTPIHKPFIISSNYPSPQKTPIHKPFIISSDYPSPQQTPIHKPFIVSSNYPSPPPQQTPIHKPFIISTNYPCPTQKTPLHEPFRTPIHRFDPVSLASIQSSQKEESSLMNNAVSSHLNLNLNSYDHSNHHHKSAHSSMSISHQGYQTNVESGNSTRNRRDHWKQ